MPASTDYVDVCPIGTVAGIPPDDAAELATAVIGALEGGFVLARARRAEEVLRTIGRQMAALVELRLATVPGR